MAGGDLTVWLGAKLLFDMTDHYEQEVEKRKVECLDSQELQSVSLHFHDVIIEVMRLCDSKGDKHDDSHNEEEIVVNKSVAAEVVPCLLVSREVATIPYPYVKLSPAR